MLVLHCQRLQCHPAQEPLGYILKPPEAYFVQRRPRYCPILQECLSSIQVVLLQRKVQCRAPVLGRGIDLPPGPARQVMHDIHVSEHGSDVKRSEASMCGETNVSPRLDQEPDNGQMPLPRRDMEGCFSLPVPVIERADPPSRRHPRMCDRIAVTTPHSLMQAHRPPTPIGPQVPGQLHKQPNTCRRAPTTLRNEIISHTSLACFSQRPVRLTAESCSSSVYKFMTILGSPRHSHRPSRPTMGVQ